MKFQFEDVKKYQDWNRQMKQILAWAETVKKPKLTFISVPKGIGKTNRGR